MDPLLRASGLGRRYGRNWVLHDVSLDVAPAEAVLVVGANGAGKSTLLTLLATLERPSAGTLTAFGEDVLQHPARVRGRIGTLGHFTYLDDALSARENLRYYADLFGVSNAEGRVRERLEAAGLLHRADDRAGAFSRGMRQRLALARALLHDPELLLLDEPFSGLDAPGARDLADQLIAQRQAQRAMLVVSHQFHRVHEWCDRVVVLHQGKLVEDRPAEAYDADGWVRHLADVAEGRA